MPKTPRSPRVLTRPARPFTAMAALSAMVFALAVPAAQSAFAAESDPALLTPADIEVSYNSGAKALMADGNTGAPAWTTEGQGSEANWVSYDLGQAAALDSLKVYWEGALATKYVVVGWDAEASQWVQLKTVTNPGDGNGGAVNTITGLAHTDTEYRYVGLALEKLRNVAWGAKIFELEVYGHDPVAADQAAPSATPLEYAGKPAVPAGATNLSRQATTTVKASSASLPAANVIDGDATTRWQAERTDTGESLTIDLHGTAAVSAITLDPEAAHAKDFTISTSVNGWNDWTTFATVTGAVQEHTIVLPTAGPTTARYVRIQVDARSGAYGSSYFEVGVFGDAASFVPAIVKGEGQNVGPLLSYGKPVHVAANNWESGAGAENLPQNVVDGDLGTRWATNPALTWQDRDNWDGTSWLAIDLGGKADAINQVSMRWNPAYAAAYGLYVSADATMPDPEDVTKWTEAYKTAAGPGKRDTVTLPDPSVTAGARWLLIDMTKEGRAGDGNFYGYSLFEVRVYGDVAPDFPINQPPTNPNDAADPDFDNLKTVWQDSFDGSAGQLPDATKWTLDPAPAGQNNSELQAYTESTDNIALDGDGHLVITAKKNADGTYTSGRLNTSRKAHAQYGRIEARAKIPAGKGLWPAFWMMGENFLTGTGWPTNGEIDIMEVLGHDTSTLYNTIHGPGYSGMGGVGGSFKPSANGSPVDLSADFHTYGIDWDSRGIRFWLDDPSNVTRTVAASTVTDDMGFPWVYDQPFYMILNLAVGGDWPGSPNAATAFPAKLIVDSVKVSQSEGSGQLKTSGFAADPRQAVVTIDAPATLPLNSAAQAQVTVSAPSNPAPAGLLTVSLDGTESVVRVTGGQASIPLTGLAVGQHILSVTYTDPKNALKSGSATTTVAVTKSGTPLGIDLGGPTIAKSERVTAVVRIPFTGSTRPTGTVKVVLEPGRIATVQLRAGDNGVAVLRLPAHSKKGTYVVKVTYSGDANFAAATASRTHVATN